MIYEFTDWVDTEVAIEGDSDVRFSAPFAQFDRPVRFANCIVEKLDLHSTYFLRGLEIENCKIRCEVFWLSGGHNKRPVRIVDCDFDGFVDVEDCLFEGEVTLRNVKFRKGTNLLGNIGTPVEVSFDSPPSLDAVEGQLDVTTYQPGGDQALP